jgi:type II restriction enzyme
LYCPSCSSPRLKPVPRNTAAIDYLCAVCDSRFQLKSQSRFFGRKILDSAYSKMRAEILEGRAPNLYVMHYDMQTWIVRNVILIPRFALVLSGLECRKPLASRARRAGWVGCNILLDKIPMDARIRIIQDGQVESTRNVRQAYDRLSPLQKLDAEKRGWTLDVLPVVRSLKKAEFHLSDVYGHAGALAKLHPNNFHVRDKIRQQLQVLRNLGIIEFLGGGDYRLV